MNSLTLARICPCVAFFADGRPVAGILALFMQISLLFWPIASRWATLARERTGIERLLEELSETNRPDLDPYAAPAKKFRQLA